MYVVDNMQLQQPTPRRLIVSFGGGLFVVAAGMAARRGIAPQEKVLFRRVNALPDELHGPVWPMMQLGSLASVGVIAGLVFRSGEARRAAAVAMAGGGAWLVCKPLKRLVHRSRPDPGVTEVIVRGPTQTGLGYPSGHAAVAAAMAAVLDHDSSAARAGGLAALAGIVGLSRVYVGAHYPLDVFGGWAVGLVMGMLGRSLLRSR